MAPSLNKSPQDSGRPGDQAEPTSDESPSGDAPFSRRATPIKVKIDRPVRMIADIPVVHGVPSGGRERIWGTLLCRLDLIIVEIGTRLLMYGNEYRSRRGHASV